MHAIVFQLTGSNSRFLLFLTGVKFRFDPATYSVNEDAGVATLTVVQFDRSLDVTGDITVLFSTADGTAEGTTRSCIAHQLHT